MSPDLWFLLWNLAAVVVTVLLHFLGTVLIVLERPRLFALASGRGRVIFGQFAIVVVVFQLLVLHLVEIAFLAICLQRLRLFSSFGNSIYFVGTSYTTVGYNGVVASAAALSEVLIAIIGFLMFGWSVSILVTTVVQYERIQFHYDPTSGAAPNPEQTSARYIVPSRSSQS